MVVAGDAWYFNKWFNDSCFLEAITSDAIREVCKYDTELLVKFPLAFNESRKPNSNSLKMLNLNLEIGFWINHKLMLIRWNYVSCPKMSHLEGKP